MDQTTSLDSIGTKEKDKLFDIKSNQYNQEIHNSNEIKNKYADEIIFFDNLKKENSKMVNKNFIANSKAKNTLNININKNYKIIKPANNQEKDKSYYKKEVFITNKKNKVIEKMKRKNSLIEKDNDTDIMIQYNILNE